jgi:hypothetical protein
MGYYRAATRFLRSATNHKLDEIANIEPLHVAAYIEGLGKDGGFSRVSPSISVTYGLPTRGFVSPLWTAFKERFGHPKAGLNPVGHTIVRSFLT